MVGDNYDVILRKEINLFTITKNVHNFIQNSEYKRERLKELYDELNKVYREMHVHLVSVILIKTEENYQINYQ